MSALNFNKLKPELFFLFFAFFFGLAILFVTPPFQSPDEINHFYRAYQISEGDVFSVKQDNRIGGYIPTSLVKITDAFAPLRWNTQAKTTRKTIIGQLKIPLNKEEKVFIDFPNTGMYSPISYFPQAMAILVLRKLNLPPLYIFYGARVFALLLWIFSIFYVIKIIPFYKWFFALVALLPMSMFINMSVSADVATNLLSFILIAYMLRLAYSDWLFTIKDFIILFVLVILLASVKLVYIPVILILLLIPKEKFSSKKAHYTQLIALFGVALGTILFWSKTMDSLYLPYSIYNSKFRDNATLISCANMHDQIHYILHHGLYLWHVFVNSMVGSFNMYFQGYIGTFGWLETKLPIQFIYLSYMVVCIVSCIDGCKGIYVKWNQKALLLFSLVIVVSLILLSQHLTWDCVGGDIIATIQGRYFIPVFPFLFMLLYNTKFARLKIVIPLVIIFSFISLSFTINTLYIRYYFVPKSKTVRTELRAEEATGLPFSANLPAVFLEHKYL
jgi:uncharacterized membrane protein